MALVGGAVCSLAIRSIRVLHSSRPAGDQCILAIVHGVGICVSKAEIEAMIHLPTDGDRRSVVDARRLAFEDINGTELWDRPHKRVNTRWKGAGEGGRKLPGSKSLNRSVAQQVNAGSIVQRVLHSSGRRKVNVSRADQVLTMHEGIGEIGNNSAGNLTFQAHADLVNLRRAKVVGESRNIGFRELHQGLRNGAGTCQQSAGHQGIRILGTNLLTVVVCLIEKNRVGREPVIRLNYRIVDLR